jgi:hypothetical protein
MIEKVAVEFDQISIQGTIPSGGYYEREMLINQETHQIIRKKSTIKYQSFTY